MTANFQRVGGRALLSILGSMVSVAVHAQLSTEAGANSLVLEEIVVTAQKRSEPLQRVAMAVSALKAEGLQELGASQFSDYARLVPGLVAVDRGVGQKKYILRGLNSENSPRLSPIVQQYLDEFPLTLTAGQQSDIRLYDIERVEVLRGPQGTLYGSGSMGGTIRTITRKPDLDAFGGSVEATASSTTHGSENVMANAALNVPVIDGKLALRVSGFSEQWSGYIDNLYTGKREGNESSAVGGRVAVRWQPVEQLDINLMLLNQTVEADARNEHTPGFVAPPSVFPPFVPWFPANAPVPGELQVFKAIEERQEDENTIANLLATYDFGNVQLTSSTTYYLQERHIEQDTAELTGFGGYLQNITEDRTLGQELRLAQSEGAFKWLVGAYYLRSESSPEDSSQIAYLPGGAVFFELGSDSESTQRALFGEASLDFASDWTATVGVRAADYEVTSTSVLLAGMGPAGQPPGSRTGPFTADENKVTTKYQLTWRPTDELSVYGVAAQGFRPGGFNDVAFDPLLNPNGAIPATYESDTLWSYELGVKSMLFDRRATWNTAIFYVDWSEIQVTGYDQQTGAVSFTTNASAAEVTGIETELSIALSAGLRLSLAASYTDAQLTKDQPAPPSGAPTRSGLPGRDGDSLPNVPKFTGSVVASYEVPLGNGGWNAFATVAANYTDESGTYLRSDDPLYRLQDDYALANLRFGAYTERWRLTAFVDNLSDERAQLFVNTLSGWDKINVNRPRTWGLTIRHTF